MDTLLASDNSGKYLPEIILIGTGSELCLCEGCAKTLRKEGRRVRVRFHLCHVLPARVSKRVGGSPMGWREYVGGQGVVIGVEEFGVSGAYLDTFNKFGFTQENVTRIDKPLLRE